MSPLHQDPYHSSDRAEGESRMMGWVSNPPHALSGPSMVSLVIGCPWSSVPPVIADHGIIAT